MAKESLTLKTQEKDKNTTVTIEKIENGYLQVENIDYKNSKGDWIYETKKTYFKESPLKNLKF